ncbi:unnamed protein product, partial [Polarella glacialis]
EPGDPVAVSAVLAALGHSATETRVAAAAALARVARRDDSSVVAALAARLEGDGPAVRQAAAVALGEVGGQGNGRAADELVARLTDQDLGVRQAAAAALRKLKGLGASAAISAASQDLRCADQAVHLREKRCNSRPTKTARLGAMSTAAR